MGAPQSGSKLHLTGWNFPCHFSWLSFFSLLSCTQVWTEELPASLHRLPSVDHPFPLGFLLGFTIFLQFCRAHGQTDSSQPLRCKYIAVGRPQAVPSYHLQCWLKFMLLLVWELRVSGEEQVRLLLDTDMKQSKDCFVTTVIVRKFVTKKWFTLSYLINSVTFILRLPFIIFFLSCLE